MKNVLTVSRVREAEEKAVQGGISVDELIERAAHSSVEEILSTIKEKGLSGTVLIIAGGGNNGADGLSAALILRSKKIDTEILLCSKKQNRFVEERIEKCKAAKIKFIERLEKTDKYCVIVDAVFGIGFKGETDGDVKDIINRVNEAKAFKIALDVPSGLNAADGKVCGAAVAADKTITFIACKAGLLLGDAPNYTGEIIVKDLGVPTSSDITVCEISDVALPARKRLSHKYDYGKAVVIGGSQNMPGAAGIASASALSALKGGAGLVVTALPDCLKNAFPITLLESMYFYLPSRDGNILFNETSLDELLDKTSSVAIGMGMKPDSELQKIIEFLSQKDITLVIDAGALGAICGKTDFLKTARAKIILTPHAGEFERLYPFDKDQPVFERVKNLAAKTNCIVLYKSAYSIVSDGKSVAFNTFGTAALAKGGSGDALSGLTAALAHRLKPFNAAYVSSCVLGLAGKKAESELGSNSLLASEAVKYFHFFI